MNNITQRFQKTINYNELNRNVEVIDINNYDNNNNITLPNSLIELHLSLDSKIVEDIKLPKLPDNLIFLSVDFNISNLKNNIPHSLKFLQLDNVENISNEILELLDIIDFIILIKCTIDDIIHPEFSLYSREDYGYDFRIYVRNTLIYNYIMDNIEDENIIKLINRYELDGKVLENIKEIIKKYNMKK